MDRPIGAVENRIRPTHDTIPRLKLEKALTIGTGEMGTRPQ